MVLARNPYVKWFVTIFLPFVIVLLPHVSVCAEWTVVTPPNVNQYWEVARVHFTSALEGWAVGNHYGADKGSLLHYQNGTWTMVTPPTVSGQWGLYGVDFTSADEGWAVGYSRFNDDSHAGVLLRYQSGVWTSVTPPAVSWNWGLYGVDLTSAGEGWAVGRNSDNPLIETGVLLHYQNGTWTSITPPTISGTWYLNAVHFTSPDEGWAVGYTASAGVLLHYQSGGWTPVTPPTVNGTWYLNAVHFTSADEGWAVGYSRLNDDSHTGVLLHYQRGTWTSVTPPTVNGTWHLNAVHFTSADDGWAAGRLGTDYTNYAGVLLHYQNGTWTPVTPPTMSGAWALGGLHFTSTDEGWAVGGDYVNLAGALLHYRRGLSPSEGTLGTEISIRGSGFGATKGTVLIGSTSLTMIDWTDGLIHCRLAKPIAPGVFDVTIIPHEQGKSPIVEKYAFTVKPPEMTSMDRNSGSAYDQVTVTGKFIGTKKGKVYLEYDQDGENVRKNCPVTKWWMDPTTNESEITFTIPKMLPEVCDVVVAPYSDLPEVEVTNGFTVKAPEIVLVSPNVGSAEDQITLSGHFLGTKRSKVYLSFLSNGKPRKKSCSIAAWSNDQIVFEVPKLPVGTYGVIVVNSVGSATLEEGFIIQ